MIKKLLLLLVLLLTLQLTQAQNAEILGNCLYDNTTNRVIIRLALRNTTGSASPLQFIGMRFGIQYNALAVTYDGYRSNMYNLSNLGLDDASFLSFIGADTGPSPAISSDSPPNDVRTANILPLSSGGTKVMQRRYINRSTATCGNENVIGSNQMKVLIDIYFTLVNSNPDYYHLNELGSYGWGDPEFIAQFLTKDNGGHTGDLNDAFKEIAIVIIRQGNTANPYQPFDMANCFAGNINPIVVTGEDVNFINPINGVLTGKIEKFSAEERNDHVALNWKVENNELVDHYEIERRVENGEFKTIGLVMSDNKNSTIQYYFKDKITARDQQLYYRVKTTGIDRIVSYSDIKMVRPGSVQQNTIKVFPNPTSEFIRFNTPLINGNYVCRVYSNEGRMVMTANASSSNPVISIKNLQTGSYFIELYHPQSGKRFYAQFSKQ